jgi:hypothetical protein
MLAYSRLNQRPDQKQITFLIRNQHSAGWWPIFPSIDRDEYGSTYATTMSVWSLEELLKKGLIVREQEPAVEAAVQRGRSWLISHNIRGQARWSDYQSSEYGQQSIGLSGLVMHVLHLLPDPAPAWLDQDWMSSLPTALPHANEQIASGKPIALLDGTVFTDTTHNFSLPWLIIATADAYPNGNLFQRAAALRLLGQLDTRRQDDLRRELQNMPWAAAELLMALRYLSGEKII